MLPERIADQIESFVASCQSPALLERGEQPLALEPDRFRVDVTPRGIWLEAWDDSRVWSRRILSIGQPARNALELEAFRFGKSNVKIALVDVADPRSGTAMERTRRSTFTRQFRLFLNRQFSNWHLDAFRGEANLEQSFSPVFPTALLTNGQQAIAALAAPDRDNGFHALTFALIWLDWVRVHHGDRAARRLLLYLPEGQERNVSLLARNLDSAKVRVEIWVYSKDGSEYELDPTDRGNVNSTLAPRYSRLAGPEWWTGLLSRHPEVDLLDAPDGGFSYRLRGLEFARLRTACGNDRAAPQFGLGRKKNATESDIPAIEALLAQLSTHRNARTADRTHPLYLSEPERWLESQVRRHILEIEATLDPHTLYGQALGSLQGVRSALDLLGIDREGILNLFELKASEDIHLPLQAFDYWLRVRHHLDHGDFTGSGYFPGRQIQTSEIRVFLVSPSLHFHPMTEAVLYWLPPKCRMTRIGLNADWRERVDVVLRM